MASLGGLPDPVVARVLVDRGVINMADKRYARALDDFEGAIRHDASIGDAYTNRGAALLGLKRYAEGKADIDRGLSLGSEEPQKAYFNRAVANEHLGDEKAAYLDYQKASELDPKWAEPKTELLRFSVQDAAP